MKTIYIVIGWYTGEDDYISGVFEKEEDANEYADAMEYDCEANYNYQFKVERWEVK
jgi:hypothetical protein